MNRIDVQHLASHDEDFVLWTAEQAALLRAGRLDRVDLDNLAEEIESLGRSEKSEIQSRLTVILTHLLKWQAQPDRRSNSWAASIVENRDRIAQIIADSPSLKSYPASIVARAYRPAPLAASGETGLAASAFPEQCPFTVEQALDDTYWPGGDPT